MTHTLFFVFGIALVVSALAVSILGLQRPDFPPSRGVLAAVLAYFALMVGATTTFAVLNAVQNPEEREHNAAAAAQAHQAQASATTGTTTTSTTSTTPAPAGPKTTLQLAANPTTIAYETTKLSAKAGQVTIDFDNPSAVTHDVCLEDSSGGQVGCSATISQSKTTLTEGLQSGSYTFYCSVDNHRAIGMEGTLTVK